MADYVRGKRHGVLKRWNNKGIAIKEELTRGEYLKEIAPLGTCVADTRALPEKGLGLLVAEYVGLL